MPWAETRVQCILTRMGQAVPDDPYQQEPGQDKDKPDAGREEFTGLVRDIFYDCNGHFEGLTLESCGSTRLYKGCEPSLEQVVIRAGSV